MPANVKGMGTYYSNVTLPKGEGVMSFDIHFDFEGVKEKEVFGLKVGANFILADMDTSEECEVLKSETQFLFLTKELTEDDAYGMIATAITQLKGYEQAKENSIDDLLEQIDLSKFSKEEMIADVKGICDWFHHNK